MLISLNSFILDVCIISYHTVSYYDVVLLKFTWYLYFRNILVYVYFTGTVCDLNNKPRLTRVYYVCYLEGKHEVYSFKEIATCEYEIIILTPLLCEHPQFKPQYVSQNEIKCLPVAGADDQPASLVELEYESLRFNYDTVKTLSNNVSIFYW